MASTRDQIIQTTCDLLESQGFHGTGLNQITTESGAPRGSLYYYFPDGKDQLAETAITVAGENVEKRIHAGLAMHDDAATAVGTFVMTIAQAVEVSGFRSGGPLTTVAMETATTNNRLNLACREAYSLIQAAFEAKLAISGYESAEASELATFITSAIEGAIFLCRTYHTGDPLRVVARQVERVVRAAHP